MNLDQEIDEIGRTLDELRVKYPSESECSHCEQIKPDENYVLFSLCPECADELHDEIVGEDTAVDACERPGSAHLAFGDGAAAELAEELQRAAELADEYFKKGTS